MNLLIEYFKSTNPKRDEEYLFCINQNCLNPLIETIYVFISDDSKLDIQNSKIEIIKNTTRPTFYDLFEFTNQNLPGQLCIIANTDIFFDNSLESLKNFNFENIFLALTRWDVYFDGKSWFKKFYDNPWWDCILPDGTKSEEDSITTSHLSQDAWIFKNPIKNHDSMKFLMGKPGCDNRIAQVFHDLGYGVRNPSKKIICHHFHQTNYRTYTNKDIIPGPYLLVTPTDELDKLSKIKSIPHF